MRGNLKKVSAQRLKQILEDRNIKQVELVEMCKPYFWKTEEGDLVDVTKYDISQYVSGRYGPDTFKAAIIGQALGINPLWIMGLPVEMVTDSALTDDQRAVVEAARRATPEQAKTFRKVLEALGADTSAEKKPDRE